MAKFRYLGVTYIGGSHGRITPVKAAPFLRSAKTTITKATRAAFSGLILTFLHTRLCRKISFPIYSKLYNCKFFCNIYFKNSDFLMTVVKLLKFKEITAIRTPVNSHLSHSIRTRQLLKSAGVGEKSGKRSRGPIHCWVKVASDWL